jgi:hypothetical protein
MGDHYLAYELPQVLLLYQTSDMPPVSMAALDIVKLDFQYTPYLFYNMIPASNSNDL